MSVGIKNRITLVEKEQSALQLESISPAGAVTEGAAVCHICGARRVPADVLGCLLVGAVDQEDTMVSRYVAAREDRMKLDPDGPQSRVHGHGQDQELSRAANLHVYVQLLTCL